MENAQIVSNIALSSLSVLLVILSVVFVVLTLRQNSRMIEQATRPYIGVSFLDLNNGIPTYELAIKNYGQSAGRVVRFKPDVDLSKYVPGHAGFPLFEGIEGLTLMPGQSLICALDYKSLRDDGIDKITVELEYSGAGKEYSEKCEVGVAVNANLVQSRVSTEGKELSTISYSLQTLTERLV